MRKTLTFAIVALALLFLVGIPAYADGGQAAEQQLTEAPGVIGLTVRSHPARTIYDAFEQLDKSGLEIVAELEGGGERHLSPEEIAVSYQRDTRFRVGDTHAFLSYGGLTVSIPVTVNRIKYDLSSIEIRDFSVIYNGKYNSFEAPFPDVVGLDGIPLRVRVNGGGAGVGKYDVSIDFETASSDYYIPDSRVVTMTVEPYRAEVVWENLSFVYDGKSKIPTAHFIDVFGNKIYPTVTGSSTNAGASYSARVLFTDPNYLLTNTETRYVIKKADYNFGEVRWSRDSFVYDGGRKSISVSGLPSGVRVVSYLNDKATNAGKYTVTARLSWEEENYNAPDALTHTWEITPAQYDISGFGFLPAQHVYDGKIHYPTLRGKMPVGRDGIELEYSFSEGACHVSDGTVSCTVTFHSKSKNYVVPEPVYSSVTVTPLGIEVNWGESEFYYNGDVQHPTALAEQCVIKVTGGESDVGSYTAEASSENSDYFIINSLFDYIILKSENRWQSLPENPICYEGRPLELPIYARFGEVQLVYFSDAEGKSVISAPTLPGKYYAKAVVFNTDNYSGIESGIFSFEIVKIVAVSFLATLNRNDLKAFEVLSPADLTCEVINNDGSREAVDSTLVAVAYQGGTSLRRADRYVTVSYGGFNCKIEVSVGFADYDLSGVSWEGTDTVYDGTAKTPTLSGLPGGVSVREYIGGGAVSAGSYTVCALLDYDRENYNQPRLDGCTLVIRKKAIEIPTVSAIYSGQPMLPESDSALYSVTSSESFRDAGEYKISATLYDPQNYEFAGGGDNCEAIFVITPRILGVTIDEVRLHLFERLREVSYKVSSGEILPGDAPTFSHYVDGNRAFLRSDDPNYTLVCSGGDIRQLYYPSGAFMLWFLLVVLLLALLGVTVYLAFIRRHRLLNAIAVIRCRWRNRNISVFPPRPMKRKRFTPIQDEREEEKDTRTEKDESASPRTDEESPDLQSEDYEAAANLEASDVSEIEDGDTDDQDEEAEGEFYSDEPCEDEEAVECASESNEPSFGMDAQHADALISDSLAKNLIKKDGEIVYTDGKSKNIVNVDTLSENFTPGDRVDVNSLKSKSLVPYDTAYIKVLARGIIDKPLSVYANDFSLSAVKMIALTGGEAIKSVTVKAKAPSEALADISEEKRDL